MEIRSFQNKDLETLNHWRERRKLPPVTLEDTPKLGYVVMRHDLPIAMAFLRLAEGNVAFAEALVTNPSASPVMASDAIDFVISKINQIAKDLNIKYLFATTSVKSVAKRLLKTHSYSVTPQVLLLNQPQK